MDQTGQSEKHQSMVLQTEKEHHSSGKLSLQLFYRVPRSASADIIKQGSDDIRVNCGVIRLDYYN